MTKFPQDTDNQSKFTGNPIDSDDQRTESGETPWHLSQQQGEAKLPTFFKQEYQSTMTGVRFNSEVNPSTPSQDGFPSPETGEDTDNPSMTATQENAWDQTSELGQNSVDEDGDQEQESDLEENIPQSLQRWSGRVWVWVKSKIPTPEEGKTAWYQRVSVWIGIGVVTVGGGTVGYGGWKFYQLYQNLPELTDLSTYSRDGTLTIKAADGTILMQRGPATREKVKLEQIPEQLVEAFVAIEDRRFYEHNGVDYQGIIRAFGSNLLAGGVVEGGSTITQQLARMVFLDQERSIVRKLREAMLATKIERQMTKEEILEQYLNLVYLGSGAYGVADAAQVYFSKPVQRLTLSEIATLAGLPPAPSQYSPLVDLESATARRNVVLQRMADAEVLTPARAEQVQQQALAVDPSSPKRLQVRAPYFASYIEKELPKYISPEALEIGGLTVETSVNLKWQEIAQKVVKEAVEIDGASQAFDQAALVAIDPRTGEVKALVGGASFAESEFNRAIQAQRQPGSTFKGLVYATAIAAGFSPYDSYKDEPYRVDGYRPMNYGNRHSNNWRSMISALSSSVNVVAVRVLVDVGFEPTIKMAKDMGIHSQLKPTYSLALGAYEVNLLELTNAYGTLAAEGNHIPAHGIRRVVNQKGETIYQADFKPKRVLDKGSAAITTWMLEGVVEGGTGTSAYLSDRQVAGKTGTSEKARDLWFIGYIPQMVTGVWLGNDDNQPTWGTSETAAYNWRQFMKEVAEDIPAEDFPKLPELDGRKGSIKAKPHQPNSIVTGGSAVQKDDPDYHRFFSNTSKANYSSSSYNGGYSSGGYSSGGYYSSGYSSGGYSSGGYSSGGYSSGGYSSGGYYSGGYSSGGYGYGGY
ncbi:transglycosylase domain-containing protein [Capilliphycus salinus ALCB114379]|uniref:transglycosylase domain-containing protein n=1 Tax=Capilliphycus salinus TaxID=2768948 RepID=UPI0039A65D4D